MFIQSRYLIAHAYSKMSSRCTKTVHLLQLHQLLSQKALLLGLKGIPHTRLTDFRAVSKLPPRHTPGGLFAMPSRAQ